MDLKYVDGAKVRRATKVGRKYLVGVAVSSWMAQHQ
jgi:hypothetical protein